MYFLIGVFFSIVATIAAVTVLVIFATELAMWRVRAIRNRWEARKRWEVRQRELAGVATAGARGFPVVPRTK